MNVSEFLKKLSLLNECVRARHTDFRDTAQVAHLLIFIGEIEGLLDQEISQSLEGTNFLLTGDAKNEYQIKESMRK